MERKSFNTAPTAWRLSAVAKGLSVLYLVSALACATASAMDLIPPLKRIKTDRPRLLLRTQPTPHAISLGDLRAIPRDAEFQEMLQRLRRRREACCQAMVYMLTGDRAAADKAVARMRQYRLRKAGDPFEIYFTFRDLALAYDWLYNYEGFTHEIKAEVRANLAPLAAAALKMSNDHIFHNYVWMSGGGTALWALAIAGEDAEADKLFREVRERLNKQLLPGMAYLDGAPGEPMGYWSLYDLTPAVLVVFAAQSGFEQDLAAVIKENQRDWLSRQLTNLMLSTQPDMRYLPWGDMQGGPNGSVTREIAGITDALTWALDSGAGAHFSRWLTEKQGLDRFFGFHGIFYFLYTRTLNVKPAPPPLAFLAGGPHGGHVLARSDWDDGATLVGFRSTDHYGDHNHFDQGSFIIYRGGPLAVNPPLYRLTRGPQQKTENHNTLLINGQGQRPVRGQWFSTLVEFKENLTGGQMLETGDILFYQDTPEWTGASGQFAQSYPAGLIKSCVRQFLFVRPQTVVIVDQLSALTGRTLGEVQWLLLTPKEPIVDNGVVTTSNGKSWLRCQPLLPGAPRVTVTPALRDTYRVSLKYKGRETLTLVHFLEVGDGTPPVVLPEVKVHATDRAIELSWEGKTFIFAAQPPFAITNQQ